MTTASQTSSVSWWKAVGAVGAIRALGAPLTMAYVLGLTHVLDPSAYGYVALVLAVTQMLTAMACNWTVNGMVRFGREEFERHQYLRDSIAARAVLMALSLVIMGGLLVGALPWIEPLVPMRESTLWWILGLACCYATSEFVLRLQQTVGRVGRFSAGFVVRSVVLVLGASACFLRWLPGTPETVLCIEMASYVAMLGWGCLGLSGYLGEWRRANVSWLGRVARYSWPMILAVLAGYVVNWVDLYVIKWYCRLDDVGVYAVAYQMMQFLVNGLVSFVIVFLPQWISWRLRGEREQMVRYLQHFVPQVLMAWSIGLVLLAAVASPLAQLVVQDRYLGAVAPLLMLLVGVQFQALSILSSNIYSAFDWLPTLTVLGVLAAVSNVALDIVAVPRVGMVGAAMATSAVVSVVGVLSFGIAQARLGIPALRALVFPLIGAAAIAGMAALQPEPVWRGVIAASSMGLLLAAGGVMGLFHPPVADGAGERWRGRRRDGALSRQPDGCRPGEGPA